VGQAEGGRANWLGGGFADKGREGGAVRASKGELRSQRGKGSFKKMPLRKVTKKFSGGESETVLAEQASTSKKNQNPRAGATKEYQPEIIDVETNHWGGGGGGWVVCKHESGGTTAGGRRAWKKRRARKAKLGITKGKGRRGKEKSRGYTRGSTAKKIRKKNGQMKEI